VSLSVIGSSLHRRTCPESVPCSPLCVKRAPPTADKRPLVESNKGSLVWPESACYGIVPSSGLPVSKILGQDVHG